MVRPTPPAAGPRAAGPQPPDEQPDGRFAGFAPAGPQESVRANRSWWDAEAGGYLAEHGEFLAGRLIWGPEGLDEADARLLGDVGGQDVLEVGAGAAQCSEWLTGRGARAVATDLSAGMLRQAGRRATGGLQLGDVLRRATGAGRPGPDRTGVSEGTGERSALLSRRIQCDARVLPFAAASFDLAFTAYGALPFVADPQRVHAEVHRVLRPGGRWVSSVTHPIRWAFPDDPGPAGLRATRSYFDSTPYVETAADGSVAYAEHHRTLGDRIRDLVGAGFTVLDVVEPPWPDDLDQVWGGWSPLRGELIPGTAIFVSQKPA